MEVELKNEIQELKQFMSVSFTEINGKFDLLHKDISNLETSYSKENEDLKTRISKNETQIETLQNDNLKLKTTITNFKSLGGIIVFFLALLNFALKFLL